MSEKTEQEYAQEFIKENLEIINQTPFLQSLLYDADLLPEQITTLRAARSMAAVVIAYTKDKDALL